MAARSNRSMECDEWRLGATMVSSRNLSPSWAKSSLLARGATARRGEDVLGRTLARRSRLCRPDASRTGTELDRSGGLELFAVEAEYHDLLLDHALDQKRAVALAPSKTLTPVADLGFRQRDQFVAFNAQHLHQPVVVEERVALRLVGPVHHAHGEKGTVG